MRVQDPDPPEHIIRRGRRRTHTPGVVVRKFRAQRRPSGLDVAERDHIVRRDGWERVGHAGVGLHARLDVVQPLLHGGAVLGHEVVRVQQRGPQPDDADQPVVEVVAAREPGVFAVRPQLRWQRDQLPRELVG